MKRAFLAKKRKGILGYFSILTVRGSSQTLGALRPLTSIYNKWQEKSKKSRLTLDIIVPG